MTSSVSAPKHKANDPYKAGRPASKKFLFGDFGRFACFAVHTRFDAVQWFVTDGERVDPYGDGIQTLVIRQCASFEEAISGLIPA